MPRSSREIEWKHCGKCMKTGPGHRKARRSAMRKSIHTERQRTRLALSRQEPTP
jgi:hypothetical protein